MSGLSYVQNKRIIYLSRKRWPTLEVAERVERQLARQIEVGRTDIDAYQQELHY